MSKVDDLTEEFAQKFGAEVDVRTLRAKLSRLDAAGIYRALAEEFCMRATALEREGEDTGG